MKRNKLKGNESFLALVLSDKRPDFRDILVNLGPHLKGMDNSKNPYLRKGMSYGKEERFCQTPGHA